MGRYHTLGNSLCFQLKLPQFYSSFRLDLQLPYLQTELSVGTVGLLLRFQLEANEANLTRAPSFSLEETGDKGEGAQGFPRHLSHQCNSWSCPFHRFTSRCVGELPRLPLTSAPSICKGVEGNGSKTITSTYPS